MTRRASTWGRRRMAPAAEPRSKIAREDDSTRIPRGAQPGAIVAVRVAGVWHEGIVSDRHDADGLPMVVHKSKRGKVATEEPWRRFAARGARVALVGYPSILPPELVLERARARIGEPWTAIDNCQRFTRRAHGVPARSPDLERTAGLVAGFLGFIGRMVRPV